MKNLGKAILLASAASATSVAQAELSATAGFLSDYVFRGVQTSSASAYASVDYEESGFYAGVWAIDLDDGDDNGGLEIDFYLGYGGEVEGIEYALGYTRYEYTDNEANGELAQNEISLDLGAGDFGFQYVYGMNEDASFESGTDDQDYNVYTLTYTDDSWGALIGYVDNDDADDIPDTDSEYYWAELSASKEIAGFDIGATVGVQFNAESAGSDTDSNDGYIVFDISKSFDL